MPGHFPLSGLVCRGMTRRIALFAVVVLIFTACAGGEAETSTSTTVDGTPDTTDAPEEPATTMADEVTTTIAAAPTTVAEGTSGAIPDPTGGATLVPYDTENITTGDVFIYWYRDTTSGNYLAMYTGPGIAGAEGMALCPGNSISTPEFLHVSNTPVEDASCEGFPTPSSSVQICSSGVWIYLTAIPGDLDGTLFGSLEWTSDDGVIRGLTSQYDTSSDIFDFEYGLSSYTLWDGFTADGSSQITCDEPMT